MSLNESVLVLKIALKILKKLFEGSNGPELDLTSRGHFRLFRSFEIEKVQNKRKTGRSDPESEIFHFFHLYLNYLYLNYTLIYTLIIP